MSFFDRFRAAAPAPTPSDAARILSQLGAEQRARRAATTDALRACVAAGAVAKLGWRR